MKEVVLEMKNIHKSFGSVKVLKGVDLTLRRGEVLGLIGENGAGKSTMIKILCGIYKATSGEIRMHGKKVDISSAAFSISFSFRPANSPFPLACSRLRKIFWAAFSSGTTLSS